MAPPSYMNAISSGNGDTANVILVRLTLLSLPRKILFKIIKIIKSTDLDDINEEIKAVTRFDMAGKQSLTIMETALGSALKESLSLEKRFGRAIPPNDIPHILLKRDHLRENSLISLLRVWLQILPILTWTDLFLGSLPLILKQKVRRTAIIKVQLSNQ